MTSQDILYLVSAALAVTFEYVPVLHEKYNAFDTTTKRLIMLGLIAAAAVALLFNQCRAVELCYTENWQTALVAFVGAIAVNQGAHLILPKALKP